METRQKKYTKKCKKIERLISDRFYELVLKEDPSYLQSLGSVQTTLCDATIYRLKKQAKYEVMSKYKDEQK